MDALLFIYLLREDKAQECPYRRNFEKTFQRSYSVHRVVL